MPKIINDRYNKVDQLPCNAMPVRQYAAATGQSMANIYTRYKRGINKEFDIVDYYGILFIVPR